MPRGIVFIFKLLYLILSYRYDNHFLIKFGFEYKPKWDFSIVATTRESYLSIKIGIPMGDNNKKVYLHIIDSLKFLNASLSALVDTCPNMTFTKYPSVSDNVKLGKGIFPYSYLNDVNKLNETELSPQDVC